MANLKQLSEIDYKRVFIMGEPGTGKTVFATTFPGKIKVYDFDGKLTSAANYWKVKDPKRLDEIEYMDCTYKDAKGSGFVAMNNDLAALKKLPEFPYKTIVIDSSTTMSNEMMNWLVHFETGIKRNVAIKSMKIACMQDYMIFAPTFSNFIYELFALPCHIVMTGHIKIQQDELTGEITRSANIPGKMSKDLPIYFPEVYVSFAKAGNFTAQTQADYKFPCRSQIPGLPKEIPLNYASLVSK